MLMDQKIKNNMSNNFNPFFYFNSFEPEPQTVTYNSELFGEIPMPYASEITDDGRIVVKNDELRDKFIKDREQYYHTIDTETPIISTTTQPTITKPTNIKPSKYKQKIDTTLPGYKNFMKALEEVSNEKDFNGLKDPEIRRIITTQAQRESKFDQNAHAKGSTASGYFQFIDSTRQKFSNYRKTDFLKDRKEQLRAAYRHFVAIHNMPSAKKLKAAGYNDDLITTLGWWYPRSMDMVLRGQKNFSFGGYSIKQAFKDYG